MLANIKKLFSTSVQIIGAAGIILVMTNSAIAADKREAVRVTIDFAKIIRLESPASTVIVGNSGIVEAAIEDDKTMILTGQAPGSTNIIVMDIDGNEVENVRVVVASDTRELTTVYQGTKRQSFSCQPRCEQVAVIGDENAAFNQALAQIFGRQQTANNN
jgi:Flp pilus assembly secretin CpaC